MDFKSLWEIGAGLGSGAVLVFDETACVIDVLWSVLSFFAHEACGQCTPCRVGTVILLSLLEKVQNGSGDPAVLEKMLKVTHLMKVASLCPLGQSVRLPVETALEKFRREFESHLKEGPCPQCKATTEVHA
jgi:NADH:ubiquinone oxidoreductase subunit F (NADH-binding)